MTDKKLERKAAEKSIREDLIIDASLHLLSKKGMNGFTMEDAANEAGFTKRTVYAYFKSKEHLLRGIVLKGFKILNQLLADALKRNSNKSGIKKIQIVGKAFLEFHKKHSDYFRAISEYENREADFSDTDAVTIECYREGEKSMNYLKQLIVEGINDNSINKQINVDVTAIALWSSISGIINLISKKQKYISKYHKIKPDVLIEEIFAMMERALKP